MRFKLTVLTILVLCSLNLAAQDFNAMISTACDSLAKKIVSSGKRKVAVVDFINLNASVTDLGKYLSEEISSELSNKTNSQANFKVLERSRLEQLIVEKELVQYYNNSAIMAQELGRLSVADILIFATITELEESYRVVIKLLDTKDGDVLGSHKINVIKNNSMKELNKHGGGSGISSQPKETTTPKITDNQSVPSNEHSNGNSQDRDCAKNKTGDFCFYNSSNKTILISFNDGSITDAYAQKITIASGESECLYNLQATNYNYGVFEYKAGIQPQAIINDLKNILKQGQVLVETCKSKNYTIK